MSEERGITQSESIALSIIRVFAMTLIVSCHIAQYYGLRIAYILNVGVQIFFFMSGFLYGRLGISSPLSFYKKRLIKVYLPYYILLAIVVIVYAICNLYQFNAKQLILYALSLQWFSKPIVGLNHLWFLTVLMIAYLLTPLITKLYKKKSLICILTIMALFALEFIVIKKFYSIFAWVALFMTGLLYGLNYSKKSSTYVILVCTMALAIMIVFFKPVWLTQQEFRYHAIWFHWILGASLFVLLFRALPLMIGEHKDLFFIKHLDDISYEVYLLHHPLVLGPLSVMSLTKNALLNIILLLLIVYILAKIFHYFCSFSKSLI